MSIDKEKFIDYYVAQVRRGNVSLFLGAGVSASAGLPSWATLLDPCAKQLGIEINGGMDLFLIAQYYANEYGESALKRIVNESINCLSDESTLINRLLDLNFKSIWTTNYDKIIEKNLARRRVLTNSIYDEKDLPNASGTNRINIYKMNGDISNLDRIVITQKDIEDYGQNHEMMLTFFKRELVVNSFLFLGYSFSDEIVLSCLASVNRCIGKSANYHFAVLKRKDEAGFNHFIKDLDERYHVRVLLIDDYDQLPDILQELKEAITKKNIFFSGVFERLSPAEDVFAESICRKLSAILLKNQYCLYTGYGRNFGNYLAGSSIQYMLAHNIEVDRFLVMRPFLQTMTEEEKRHHRSMLIGSCHYAIFMFGQSPQNGYYTNSTGMIKEFEIAKDMGKVIIPIGSTGFTAKQIWADVRAHITLYPYLEKYIDVLGEPIDNARVEKLTKAVFQIIVDCS